ncbi:MAG: TauD/TfdA family dioxygenase [Proteobacteria bacterium]|nr:TauD/TfdA family dioxygenase [Pseudomonadota bacterium]
MLARASEWCIPLLPNEITELEKAAEPWLTSGKNIAGITAESFPLPTLAPKLHAMKNELIHGRGFALLRGLPKDRYTEREAGTMFYGLGSHLGVTRSQNAQGHILGHVRDLGMKSSDPNVRIYQTNERQTFHTDSSDVVALLCLKTAKSGGDSLLVSASTLFNEMHRRRPDLLALLLQPFAVDRRGEVPPGMLPYFMLPVFSYHLGFLTVYYQRQYIDSAQRFTDAPRLTPEQIEALDMFDQLTNDPKIHFSMTLEPGDMQFVYNHTMLHDRTGFEDWPEEKQKRHLLRLWLSIPGDRPLPESFAPRFGTLEPGNRGGIVVANTKLHIAWVTE